MSQTPAQKKSKPQSPPTLDGAASVFAAVLAKDEGLLWQSRPGAGAYAMAHLRTLIMGMAFLIVAFAWNIMVTRNTALPQLAIVTWLFAAFGVIYLLMPALAYVQGKWFVFYGLTNQRLITLTLYPKRRVDSFPIKTLNRVVPHGGHTGLSTLLIDAPGAVSKSPMRPRAGFYGIKYATQVVEAITTLQDPEAALKRAQTQKAQMLKQTQPSAEKSPFSPSSQSRTGENGTMH